MNNIKIALADDQQLFRQSLGALITSIPEFEMFFEAENGIDFLRRLNEQKNLPEIALIDIEMPEMDGMKLLEKLKENYPSIKILILSIHTNERLFSRLIKMGACGYLMKNCNKVELITAIKSTSQNGFYINHHTLKAMQNSNGKNVNLKNMNTVDLNLTQREIEVLTLICDELSTLEIAEKLFISPRTVDGHRNNLLLKTGVKNTAGLVLFAIKNNLVEIY